MSAPIKTAVILAAGRGTRLRPLTYDIPKGFVKVDGITLIERSINTLKQHGIENIIIGCGHQGVHYEGIQEKYGLTIYYNDEYASTGSLYTMILSNQHVDSDFILLESDIMYEPRAIQTLLSEEHTDIILASGTTHSGDEVYVETHDDGILKKLSKKRDDIEQLTGELVGVSRISKGTLNVLAELVESDQAFRKADYEDGLVHVAIAQGVGVRLVDDLVWCEIDNEEHLERAHNIILPKLLTKS